MFEQQKMIVTGGSGLLGSELKKLMPDACFPAHGEFDVTNYDQMNNFLKGKEFKYLFHGAALTSPPRVDKNPLQAIDVNVMGTANMVKACSKYKLKIIYVSTDYVFKGDKGNYKENDPVYPVNKYALSKLGGECTVRLYDNSLIIRTTFGPNIFPYEKAFIDQWTGRESVEKIARKITSFLIKNIDINGIIHIGGERKTVYDYARDLDRNKTIGRISIKDVSFDVPADTSLNCEKYNELMIEQEDSCEK